MIVRDLCRCEANTKYNGVGVTRVYRLGTRRGNLIDHLFIDRSIDRQPVTRHSRGRHRMELCTAPRSRGKPCLEGLKIGRSEATTSIASLPPYQRAVAGTLSNCT
jgi:hypothetical protein